MAEGAIAPWAESDCFTPLQQAQRRGRGPLEQLEARGVLDVLTAARARVAGHPYAGDRIEQELQKLGLPPGGGVATKGLRVMVCEGGLLLECPEPEPWMTTEVATLFPEQPVGWRISQINLPSAEDDEVTDGFVGQLVGAARGPHRGAKWALWAMARFAQMVTDRA
jgi:hypothetical protein